MPEMTLEELRVILVDCAGEDETIDVSGDIADVGFDALGYDSLALLEMAARIEQIRLVKIPDGVVDDLKTPRTVLDLVNAMLVAAVAGTAAE
jgi:minimal PKS acyl carrier protein